MPTPKQTETVKPKRVYDKCPQIGEFANEEIESCQKRNVPKCPLLHKWSITMKYSIVKGDRSIDYTVNAPVPLITLLFISHHPYSLSVHDNLKQPIPILNNLNSPKQIPNQTLKKLVSNSPYIPINTPG